MNGFAGNTTATSKNTAITARHKAARELPLDCCTAFAGTECGVSFGFFLRLHATEKYKIRMPAFHKKAEGGALSG
jgi:hypothetical protein